jgi:CO/xanthine dehydrogenase FAD-binding subunit
LCTNKFSGDNRVSFRPATLEEALARLGAGARPLAGGTDLMAGAGEAGYAAALVDLSRLAELRGVAREAGEIRIGGAATWSEIARAPLPPAFDALKAAAREIGAIQIQNRGTIGGNLCNASPAADGVPPLLALEAEVELASPRGRRRLPLAEFLQGPRRTALAGDEILAAVVCPAPPEGMRSAFLKLGARRYLVISIVMVAVALDIETGRVRAARIAVGACSPVALRLSAAERALEGAPARPGLGQRLAAEHFAVLSPIDDLRADAAYRRAAALTLTRRAVELALAGESGGAI